MDSKQRDANQDRMPAKGLRQAGSTAQLGYRLARDTFDAIKRWTPVQELRRRWSFPPSRKVEAAPIGVVAEPIRSSAVERD